MNEILKRLERGPLVRNGAIGTMLHQKGAELGGCIGEWIVNHPSTLGKILQGYFRAGCNVCGGGTSGLNRLRLEKYGLQDKVRELNEKVVSIARKIKPRDGFVAAIVGPTEKFLHPVGELRLEDAMAIFAEQSEALVEGGADLICIDTMYDLEEAVAALKAAKMVTDLPVSVSMAFNPGPAGFRTLMGVSPESAAARLEEEGADIIGANCGGLTLDQMSSVIILMNRCCRKPISAKPNAGLPQMVNGKSVYPVSPEGFAEWVPQWIEAGAKVISGCCGTTPQHLELAVERIKTMPFSAH